MLYIFDANEAVIKMIIKGRSPTVRHVSRTHIVALDWLIGRINLDPKIKIRYVESKNQLADILTEGLVTRDEWNHLLCLFNISLFSCQNCAEFNSQSCSESMAKRLQEGDYDERVVAKSKPIRHLVSRSSAKPSTTPSLTVSSSLGKFGSKDHEMRYETRAVKPRSATQKESLIKRDRVTNSQERHEDKAALRSALKIALMPWRRDRRKVITTGASSPNRNQLDMWYRGAVRGHQRRHRRRYLQARGNSDIKNTKKGLKQTRGSPSSEIHKKTSLKVIQ